MGNDFWHEGYGAGLSGLNWVAVVLGRFLTQDERLELYQGWKAGLDELCERERQMEEADAEAADQRARERALAAAGVDACGGDEIPF